MYNEFQKAKLLGISFSAEDFTKEQIDAFFIIDKKMSEISKR